MPIPTEPIGSIPRPAALAGAMRRRAAGRLSRLEFDLQGDAAVRETIAALEAAEFIPPERLGTTDDCGFSPFGDDVSTPRDVAFAKVRARVAGTALAAAVLRA